MGLQKLVIILGPILLVAGAAYFVHVSDRRQRLPMLLGWIFPGLGHWAAGFRPRAVFFATQLVALWVAGLWMSEWRCISLFDRHPIWALTQIPNGALTLVTAFLTRNLFIEHDNALYQVGSLYVGVAGLLNVVALCDLYDITETESQRLLRRQRKGAA